MTRRQAAWAMVALLAAGVIWAVWVGPFLAVDRCLDRGGAWDHDAETCRTE